MAAFRRRTVFAAPVIITVAASCSERNSDVKPQPPAPPTYTVWMENMQCRAQRTTSGAAPVQAIVCPPGMSGRTRMSLIETAAGTCMTVPAKHVTPCPLPPGKPLVQALGIVWTIEKRGADCHAEEEDECPPGLDCNPPKPRTFPCPPGVTEDRPLRFAELADATCVVVPDGCTDTACATEPVACPPEIGR